MPKEKGFDLIDKNEPFIVRIFLVESNEYPS
jgi:hypothetical protein